VAVVALWVRNWSRAETLRYFGNGVRLSLISADGSIGIAKWQAPTSAPSSHGRWLYWPTPTPWVMQDHPLPDRGPRGFAFGKKSDDGFGAEWWVAVPHWCLAAVLAVPMLAWAWAHARRLPGLFTALSLLLCLAAAVLWVRSHWVGETWDWNGWKGTRDAGLASARGQLSFYWEPPAQPWHNPLLPPGEVSYYGTTDPHRLDAHVHSIRSDANTRGFGPRLGFALFLQFPDPGGTNHVEAAVPYWPVTLALATAPALRLRRRWRRRGGPPVCGNCGYDLRATPGRCPECGTAASRRAEIMA